MDEGQLVVDGVVIVKELVEALAPVIQRWIESGNVNALVMLRAVIPDPAALVKLDVALEAAQLRNRFTTTRPSALLRAAPSSAA